jgi:hypothetical protein
LDIFEVTSPEPIRMMEISPKVWIFHKLFCVFIWFHFVFQYFDNSTSRFTPRRITGSAKSTWSCATDATTTASAAYAILTAAGIKSPTLVNHTHLGNWIFRQGHGPQSESVPKHLRHPLTFFRFISLVLSIIRAPTTKSIDRLLQDVSSSSPGICDACIAKKRLLVTWGQAVHLSCAIKLPEPMSSMPVTWYYYSREKGQYQLSFRYNFICSISWWGSAV